MNFGLNYDLLLTMLVIHLFKHISASEIIYLMPYSNYMHHYNINLSYHFHCQIIISASMDY
jgi:hypothetical protein